MIVSEKALPAFSVSERTAEAKWKGDAAGVCGPAPSALLRGFPGGAEVKPGGVPISLPAGEAPLAAFAAGNTVAVCCGKQLAAQSAFFEAYRTAQIGGLEKNV